MNQPTCREIAEEYALWQEYADAHGEGTEAEFASLSTETKIGWLHYMFPHDCSCDTDTDRAIPAVDTFDADSGLPAQ